MWLLLLLLLLLPSLETNVSLAHGFLYSSLKYILSPQPTIWGFGNNWLLKQTVRIGHILKILLPESLPSNDGMVTGNV